MENIKSVSGSYSYLIGITPSNAVYKYIYNVCFSKLIAGVGEPATLLPPGLQVSFIKAAKELNKDIYPPGNSFLFF